MNVLLPLNYIQFSLKLYGDILIYQLVLAQACSSLYVSYFFKFVQKVTPSSSNNGVQYNTTNHIAWIPIQALSNLFHLLAVLIMQDNLRGNIFIIKISEVKIWKSHDFMMYKFRFYFICNCFQILNFKLHNQLKSYIPRFGDQLHT